MRRCERVAGHVAPSPSPAAAADIAASTVAAIHALPQLSADVLSNARHLSCDARRLRQSLRAIQYVAADLQNPREQTGIATAASNFLSIIGEAFNFGDLATPPELARQIN